MVLKQKNIYAAFLDDIRENYIDDTPRLIYADFLEDQGQEERAEFIRLQCEIEKLRSTCGCLGCSRLQEREKGETVIDIACIFDGPSPVLARENELLTRNWDSWTGGLPVSKEYDFLTARFVRGFLPWLGVTQEDFMNHAREIAKLRWPPTLVQQVRLIDRFPHETNNDYFWSTRESGNMTGPDFVRWELFGALEQGRFMHLTSFRYMSYPTAEEAHLDLGRACVRHLKTIGRFSS